MQNKKEDGNKVSQAAFAKAAYLVYPLLNQLVPLGDVRKVTILTLDRSQMNRKIDEKSARSIMFHDSNGKAIRSNREVTGTLLSMVEATEENTGLRVCYITTKMRDKGDELWDVYLGKPRKDMTIRETLEAELKEAVELVKSV